MLQLWLALVLGGFAFAQNRMWTEAETSRKVEGQILDKLIDSSKAQVRLKSGKTVWLEAARLIKADQQYIEAWIKPIKHLSVRVVGSKDGQKTIEVKAEAGHADIVVKGFSSAQDPSPVIKKIKKGATVTFKYTATSRYVVKVFRKDILVEEESWNKKTGL